MVLLQQSRLKERGCIANRIGCEAGRPIHFFRQRKDLSQERVVWIALYHPRDIGPGSKEGKGSSGAERRLEEGRRKLNGGN